MASEETVRSADARVDPGAGLTREWSGLDADFRTRVRAAAATDRGRGFRTALADELAELRGRTSPIGLPALVRREVAVELRRFGAAYHRAIEAITGAWRSSDLLRQVVRLSPPLESLMEALPEPTEVRIHLARLDLLPNRNGGFRVVETNANCPGALLTCSVASRRWRTYLGSLGIALPPPLEYEAPEWMASWLIEAAAAETGVAPEFVVLLREAGGNRLELPGLATQLRRLGIGAVEADPRELTISAGGDVSLRGRRVLHAYWKVGIREFDRMRPELTDLVGALQDRRLFVQNGFPARFVADHKCCLAVLHDPRFDHLFDPDDLRLIRGSLPWSQNVAMCTASELRRIRSDRADYVLKRPLDTRGRGVVIGREIGSRDAWRGAVDYAVEGGWLVQEFCETTELQTCDAERRVHDLSLGLIRGRLVGALMRSSGELRTNVALTGRLHPVFMEADPALRRTTVAAGD